MKIILFLLVITIYVFSSPPGLMTGDGGEFITSACTLGISHPPGYPLYCLFGKLSSLLPLSNLAWRVTFSSILFSALTSVLLFILLKALTKSRLISFITCLIYSLSSTVWSQALVAKIYPLNAFLIVFSLLCLVQWQEKEDNRYLYLFSMVFGISLTNHYPLVIVASPSYLVLILFNYKRLSLKGSLISAGFVLLALLVYAYLPIRSSMNPPNDWGNPDNLKNFLSHVLRKQYRLLELGQKVGLSDKLNFIREYFYELYEQFSFFVIPALIGLWALFKENKKLFLSFILLFLTNSILLTYILQFGFNPERLGIVRVYYIPSYIALALFIGIGLNYIYNSLQSKALKAVTAIFVIFCSVIGLSYSCQNNFNRNDFLAYDYGSNLLSFLKKDSTVFILKAGDESLFSTLFLQKVMAKRPDLKIIDCWGNVFENVYGDDFSLISDKTEWINRRNQVERGIINDTNKPVYYISFDTNDAVHGFALKSQGLVYLVEPPSRLAGSRPLDGTLNNVTSRLRCFDAESDRTVGHGGIDKENQKNSILSSNSNIWQMYNYRGLYGKGFIDYQEQEIAGYYYYTAGLEALSGGMNKSAPYFEKAAETSGDVSWIMNNIGLAYFRNSNYDKAEAVFKSLLKKYPDNNIGWYNLGLVYKNSGREDKAQECFKKCVSSDPQDLDSYKELADIFFSNGDLENANKYLGELKNNKKYADMYSLSGTNFYVKKDIRKAIDEWQKAILVKPEANVYYNLGVAYLDIKDFVKARETLNKYISLEPGSQLSKNVRSVLKNIDKNIDN